MSSIYWSEFKKLTKKYVKDNADLRKKYNVDDDDDDEAAAAEPTKKRVEREEESEEKPVPAPAIAPIPAIVPVKPAAAPAKPAAPAKSAASAKPAKSAKPAAAADKEEDTNWTCVGRIWEDPAIPCQGGPKATQRCGIKHPNGKERVSVYKKCYNARERKKNQEKRDAKRAKIQDALEG